MSGSRLINHAETARTILAWLVAACATGIMIAGCFAKSTRWTDFAAGRSTAWSDGIQPLAVWAVLGGGAILISLLWSLRDEHWIPFGVASLLIFWRVATVADSYRNWLESADWVSVYDHQKIAFGLRAVPFIATIGVLSTMLLTAVATWLLVQNHRVLPGPQSA